MRLESGKDMLSLSTLWGNRPMNSEKSHCAPVYDEQLGAKQEA